jgi:hypothetical protein
MSRDCLWKAWHKACFNLGIEGVDLYGGTRHSSATDLRKYFSPEQIKQATMHSTNKAFERYFQVQVEDIVKMYQRTADTKPTPNNRVSEKGKVIEITNKS